MLADASATRRCGWLFLLVALCVVAFTLVVAAVVLLFLSTENYSITIALIGIATGILPYAFITKKPTTKSVDGTSSDSTDTTPTNSPKSSSNTIQRVGEQIIEVLKSKSTTASNASTSDDEKK